MQRTTWVTGLVLAALLALSSGSALAASAQGEVTLRSLEAGTEDANAFKVTVGGEMVEARCRFYLDEYFEKSIIWANAEITNLTDAPVHYAYYVAFLDDEGELVGCASQTSMMNGLGAGESTTLANCLIPLPEEAFGRVSRYRVVIYESGEEIGRD
jgi:hypothetical protein